MVNYQTWKNGVRRATFVLIAANVALFHPMGAGDDDEVTAAKAKMWTAIDIHSLGSSIHHAVMKYPGQKAPYARCEPVQIVDIAENLLAFQNGDGGWPVNIDWLKAFPDSELADLPHGQEGKTGKKSTLDNDNTWSQIGYLAHVYQQTHLKRYADSALKGIDYLLREQRPSGGWRGADVEAVTFNDGVMVGVLEALKAAAEMRPLYDFVDKERCAAARKGYAKGIDCILDCQIKVDGRLTAWCEQHDHDTLKPIWARTFEPPSITPDESVGVVRLLMRIENPPPEVVTAIKSAVAWFDKVKITGLKIEKAPAEPVTYKWHWTDCDYVETKDPSAPPIWARYYDCETEAPIFCNRERKITPNFAELDRERRTGMPWYGYWPAKLMEKEYPAWERKTAAFLGLPRLYVIGDSTAAFNEPDRYPRMGWAQVLQEYFDATKLLVVDQAKGGQSAKSYCEEDIWKDTLTRLKKDDYVFIQFGHNDSKKEDPKKFTDPATTYKQYLNNFVEKARAKGAIPVLLTSINRNSWANEKTMKDTLGGYPSAMRELADELHVDLIDLHRMTKSLFEELGREKTAKTLFMNLENGAYPHYPEPKKGIWILRW